MLDMSDVVNDLDLAQPFTILRPTGAFAAGKFVESSQTIEAYGVISVATAEDLQQVPEADRVTGAMVFHSSTPILHTGTQGTSDILLWRDQRYRVSVVFPYADYGYWKAFAVRTQGS